MTNLASSELLKAISFNQKSWKAQGMAPFRAMIRWLVSRNSPMSMPKGQTVRQSPQWLQEAMNRLAMVPSPARVPGWRVASTSSAAFMGIFPACRIRSQ